MRRREAYIYVVGPPHAIGHVYVMGLAIAPFDPERGTLFLTAKFRFRDHMQGKVLRPG